MRWLVEWDKLSCYWMYGIEGLDGPDGTGVGWRDQRYWALGRERLHLLLMCGGRQEVVAATIFICVAGGTEYLIYGTQILTAI